MTDSFKYPAAVNRIHDGDTVFLNVFLSKAGKAGAVHTDVDLGFNIHQQRNGLWLVDQSVRLKGIDAPELATVLGKVSLAYLETILKPGDPVTLISHGWDKYGSRIDGSIILPDGRDLSRLMVDTGHALPWDGTGPKPTGGTP